VYRCGLLRSTRQVKNPQLTPDCESQSASREGWHGGSTVLACVCRRPPRFLLLCAATTAQACARCAAPRPLRRHRSRWGRVTNARAPAWEFARDALGVRLAAYSGCVFLPGGSALHALQRAYAARMRRGGQAPHVNVHSVAWVSSRASGRATLPRLTRDPGAPGAARVRACVLAARRAHNGRGAPRWRAAQPARVPVRYRPHASRRSARCVRLTSRAVPPPRASQPRVLCAPHGRRRRGPARERCAAWHPGARVAPTWRQRAEEGAAHAARARRSRTRLLRAPRRAGVHAPRHAAARGAAAVLRRLQRRVQ
jgi:hypothetical protein